MTTPYQHRKGITQIFWGSHRGLKVYLYKIVNASGASVSLTNYGASIVSIEVPDRNGKLGNVILGYPSLEGYIQDTCYMGSTIGRFANRIGKASFELDGKTYSLDKNDDENSNHGGYRGFHSQVFDSSINQDVLSFTIFSEDGQGGYPGNLQFQIDYFWSEENELSITFKAKTDKRTIANFTNHAYFNLLPGARDVFDHILTVRAEEVLEQAGDFIPTGTIIPAGEKAFNEHRISERITKQGDLLTGVNTYYIFPAGKVFEKVPACILSEPVSGRRLEIYTSYPGLQIYTGDFLSKNPLNESAFLHPFSGLCLECHQYPDYPNHPNFPAKLIVPGNVYSENIRYKFSVYE